MRLAESVQLPEKLYYVYFKNKIKTIVDPGTT